VNDDFVNLSALNQFAYCPRRCGLIYQEGEFADNLHTARGNAEHARVDRLDHVVTREGARAEYALPIWSDRIGLIGKCDVVEFWPDGTVFPVEYKHGPRRKWLNDDPQLAGQAMCLSVIDSGTLPPALNDARCRECSLKPRCQPELLGAVDGQRSLARTLFEAAP